MYQVIMAVCSLQQLKQLKIFRSSTILHVAADFIIFCWKSMHKIYTFWGSARGRIGHKSEARMILRR
jgi:hypothetical protein